MIKGLTERIKKVVLGLEPSAEIILYGSRARNDYREYSDWDFLFLVDGRVENDRTDRIRCALFEIELSENALVSLYGHSRAGGNPVISDIYRFPPSRE